MSPKALHRFAVSLPVFFLREKRAVIAFTPALDLSASGTSAERAKRNFETTLRLFLAELVKRGTLDRVLGDMGWSKQECHWQPPVEARNATTVPFRLPVAS